MKTIFHTIVACSVLFTANSKAATDYAVHEWGTFTSIQGGAGELLPWHAQQISELPGFVYNMSNPGMNRAAPFIGKGMLTTLQRLETPVIYFYANEPMKVDVNVAFPKGSITEWFPQATQLGPTLPKDTNAPADGTLAESRAIWRGLEIFPDTKEYDRGLSQDASGSHYFAARATGANLVRANFATPTNNASELEKFIFYRGSGSFKTPLHVGIDSNQMVTVENTGAQPLAHLFIINIHDGMGSFRVLDELSASNSVVWTHLNAEAGDYWKQFPLAQFQTEIGNEMHDALMSEGLFGDEASAMVNTWKDSWFTEDGVRVLYILPRAWTDEILPLTLDPQPKELTRVMVGRAEIITPDVARNLYESLVKAKGGDANSRIAAGKELKKLGRFAEPALRLANAYFHPANEKELGDLWNLGFTLLSQNLAAGN